MPNFAASVTPTNPNQSTEPLSKNLHNPRNQSPQIPIIREGTGTPRKNLHNPQNQSPHLLNIRAGHQTKTSAQSVVAMTNRRTSGQLWTVESRKLREAL
jgi:hypothetical protein